MRASLQQLAIIDLRRDDSSPPRAAQSIQSVCRASSNVRNCGSVPAAAETVGRRSLLLGLIRSGSRRRAAALWTPTRAVATQVISARFAQTQPDPASLPEPPSEPPRRVECKEDKRQPEMHEDIVSTLVNIDGSGRVECSRITRVEPEPAQIDLPTVIVQGLRLRFARPEETPYMRILNAHAPSRNGLQVSPFDRVKPREYPECKRRA